MPRCLRIRYVSYLIFSFIGPSIGTFHFSEQCDDNTGPLHCVNAITYIGEVTPAENDCNIHLICAGLLCTLIQEGEVTSI
jgi:hypothetical protein